MAASLSKLLANRLNALKSTGPKSAEGKARSRQNARTHGLSKVGACPPPELAAAIADRKDAWRPDYQPDSPAKEWAFERLCAESVRLDFCESRISAARAERAERASESWDDDQAAAVAERASRLSKRPEVIQPTLLQSRHGVLWLLERWDEVAAHLARLDGWSPEAWNLACDLLGVPNSAREGTGPWDLDPDDSSAAPGLAFVSQCVAALRHRLDTVLDDRDARAQLDASLGLDADDPPAIRLLERYAADARRRLSWCLNELRRSPRDTAAPASAPAPESAPAIPAGPPGPRPVRSSSLKPSPPPHDPPSEPAFSAPALAPPPSTVPEPRPARLPNASPSTTPTAPIIQNRRARRAQAARARHS